MLNFIDPRWILLIRLMEEFCLPEFLRHVFSDIFCLAGKAVGLKPFCFVCVEPFIGSFRLRFGLRLKPQNLRLIYKAAQGSNTNL